MFRNLVESGSHHKDMKRRGSFFAGTLAFYMLLLSAAGVASIYAYNTNLDTRDELEILALMRFPAQTASAEPERTAAPKATSESRVPQAVRRPEASVITPYSNSREVAAASTREISPRVPVEIGEDNGLDVPVTVGPIGPNVPGVSTGTRSDGPLVGDDVEAPAREKVVPKQEPAQEKPRIPVHLPSSVIAGKAIQKPVPPYPAFAKNAHVQGTVAVQILIDEQGRVVSAQATSGHPLLQKSAVDAAYKARFSPTLVGGQPYKVSGVIFYNFMLN